MIALGVPAQALIGGVTVLTDLNPWIVSFHLLVSMAMIGVCVLLLDVLRGPARPAARRAAYAASAWAVFAAGWLVLYVGTVVTGSGPHAGDLDSPRTGLDPLQVSQLHADAVFLFVGLTVGLALTTPGRRPAGGGRAAGRSSWPRGRSGSSSTPPTCRSCWSASTCWGRRWCPRR